MHRAPCSLPHCRHRSQHTGTGHEVPEQSTLPPCAGRFAPCTWWPVPVWCKMHWSHLTPCPIADTARWARAITKQSCIADCHATPHSPALLTAPLHRKAGLSPHLVVPLVADPVLDGVSPILIVHSGAFASAQGIPHGPDLQQYLCPTLTLLLAAGVAALQQQQSALVPATKHALGQPSRCCLPLQLCSSIGLCRFLTGTLCHITNSALAQTCTLPMHGAERGGCLQAVGCCQAALLKTAVRHNTVHMVSD